MKYNLHVNQHQAIELGITNINQAHIFDFLTVCAVWADPIVIDDVVYYWAARQYIADELQILDLKPDTVYRHLKSLDEIGLIEYKKSGKKDCIRITKKGKKYHSDTMSEINPNYYVGNKSEKNSEINPTDHTTNINHNNKKNKQKKEAKIDHLLEDLEDENLNDSETKILHDFFKYRKEIQKTIKTAAPLKAFLRELRKIHEAGFDVLEVIQLMEEKEWQTLKLEYVQNSLGSSKAVSTQAATPKTFYAATQEQKQIKQNSTLANIARVRELREKGQI